MLLVPSTKYSDTGLHIPWGEGWFPDVNEVGVDLRMLGIDQFQLRRQHTSRDLWIGLPEDVEPLLLVHRSPLHKSIELFSFDEIASVLHYRPSLVFPFQEWSGFKDECLAICFLCRLKNPSSAVCIPDDMRLWKSIPEGLQNLFSGLNSERQDDRLGIDEDLLAIGQSLQDNSILGYLQGLMSEHISRPIF